MSYTPPFETEEYLPNQTMPSPWTAFTPITNPDDLIVGLVYDIYTTPGYYGNARRLPRGRRTRTRKQKNRKSRRQRNRNFQRNYTSHMWGKIFNITNESIAVKQVYFAYNYALEAMEEVEYDDLYIIPRANFYYANLETLNEKLEDPDYDELTEPYRKLILMYAANQRIPYGASVVENAYSEM